jgi:hypothetical protein
MLWKRDKIKKNMGIEKLLTSSERRDRLKSEIQSWDKSPQNVYLEVPDFLK